ncbi:hypothetical protein LOTGIDRAFT_175231 [Lottia gigantea]|uniref:G-protein coupled receptors family 1 profile domain-containing protein n=1 Tax=Lottia gigantea TaxID=225164 RepID=V4AKE3_LOTGI|nr:hypothetical protein LOTGIDRAFT_175231 [Lottia gigantea]ESO95205.1 hypothetical protein LOTGIDRAFT_175231 [Lottia gigantea]
MLGIAPSIFICMNTVTFVLSLIGNISVLVLLWRNLHLRDVDTVLHVSLAITALLFCNVCGIQWIFFFADLPTSFDVICSFCPFFNWANILLLAFLLVWRSVRFLKKDWMQSKKNGYVAVVITVAIGVTCFVILFLTGKNRCQFNSEIQSTRFFLAVVIRETTLILAFVFTQSVQFYRIYSNYKHLALGKKKRVIFLRREKPAIIGSIILMSIFLTPRIITLSIYSHYVVYENISSSVFEFLRNFNQIPPALYPYAVVLMTRQFRPEFVAMLKCVSKKSSKIFIMKPKFEEKMEKMENMACDNKRVDSSKEENGFHDLDTVAVKSISSGSLVTFPATSGQMNPSGVHVYSSGIR